MENGYKKGQQTRRRILEAALEMARTSGYHSLNVRDICVEANVTTGAFYHHFSSKQDLISAMFTTGQSNFVPFIETVLKGKPIEQQLMEYAYYFAKMNEYSGYDDLVERFAPKTHWFKEGKHIICDLLTEIVRAGVESGKMKPGDPAELSYYLVTILRGCVLDWCMHSCEYDLAQRMTRYFELALPPLFIEWSEPVSVGE